MLVLTLFLSLVQVLSGLFQLFSLIFKEIMGSGLYDNFHGSTLESGSTHPFEPGPRVRSSTFFLQADLTCKSNKFSIPRDTILKLLVK